MEWKNTDPRFSIDGNDDIIILRPSLSKIGWEVCAGNVYSSEESFIIFTEFADHKTIKADEEWDFSWKWIYQPKR